jgi:hypothetical protein
LASLIAAILDILVLLALICFQISINNNVQYICEMAP